MAGQESMVTIRQARQQDKEAWDEFVLTRRDTAAYSLFAWKEAVQTAYGHNGLYLLAEKKGKVCGVLPLICFGTPWGAKSLVALPYCDTGEVIAKSPDIQNQLIDKAVDLARSFAVDRLEIRSSMPCLFSDVSMTNVQVQTGKVRMLLKLPASSELLWNSFKSKLRSQIRKAEKNGLSFRWGNLVDLEPFYHVFSRNMHLLGSPVHSRNWLSQVLKQFGPHAKIGLVYKNTQPIGGGIILSTEHTVSIPWASTLREFNRLSPNMLLYWNFLKFAANTNRKVFDFGRSTLNEGTYRFKKQWGARPYPLYWYRFSPAGNGRKHHPFATSSGKRQLLASMWTWLPLPMANTCGPVVRKYISL